jgi:hypothetical protein
VHAHDDGMPKKLYVVTLMDIDQVVYKIKVKSPCCCDMWDYIMDLDLPIIPAFMSILEVVDEAVPVVEH